ncbi:hypothetical protein GCM10023115_28250 [Pontixanthobacter gangjinensis]|uniref:site-specific DNA-methyltransferase (adenine-specific) n=1 Tax=Christiangramia aestuarii TaxID=1028746 RepID=A0A7K1LMP3_9FLAO|nr:TaqI-like C-terminal specificity domain-containing protein [Christiangramia aestuarii]MUP42057.1 hypothetical protein [Christiangramia aestuarii]
MNQKELQQLLQQPYTTENWKQLISHVFKNVQLVETPREIPIDDKRVKSLKQYGTVQLNDGKFLALFELTLHDNVNLIRNRVGLNDIVSKYIDQDTTHGVLSIFEQGNEDYRFTFTAHATEFDEEEGEFVEKETDTKRFTYILGKNESCRTAAQRFDELSSKKETADMNAVEKAFSVEKLSKLFFNEYTEQFDKLVKYIKSKPEYYEGVFDEEESAARNFVKIFLGRLVFIKFVEKKGWMGVPAKETGWKNGDYKFLRNQFNKYENKDKFLNEFLNPLFFDALNTGERENDVFELTGTKIPHLSGGLFENEDPHTLEIDFPKGYLEELFEFFDRYNFTIDENDVHDKEVGVDPEMLGHIFENLLEDNKDKGAFYTPKEIVRYMCQESLKEYLKTFLKKQNLWPDDKEGVEESQSLLNNFVEKKEVSSILKWDKPLATALRDVKICDPAIGSGAFPMGLLNEIFRLVKNLHDESPDSVGAIWGMPGKEWQAHRVKLNIIQNSIYGVDIEPGAVNIARLRFWLSLIIDEDEPKPLPHLDFKIITGNSLVSKLGDSVIEIDWGMNSSSGANSIYKEKLQNALRLLIVKENTFFESDFESNLKEEIDHLKIDILIFQLKYNKEAYSNSNTIKLDLGFGLTATEKSNNARIKKKIETFDNLISDLEILKGNPKMMLDFFDWRLSFPEILNQEVVSKVGFDIVIGNPPYMGERKNKKVFIDVQKGFLKKYYLGRMDYFYFFYHLGLDLLKKNGSLIFITTNYFPTAMGAKKLRLDIKNRTSILQIVNFNEAKIFDSAYGQHNVIMQLKKGHHKIACISKTIDYKKFLPSKLLSKVLWSKSDFLCTTNFVQQLSLWEGDENYLRFNGVYNETSNSTPINKILNRIKTSSNFLLKDICTPLIGLESSLDKVFVIDKTEVNSIIFNSNEEQLLKPLFKNSDINKYTVNKNSNRRIFYLHEKIKKIQQFEGIWNYLKKHESLIKGRKGANLKGAYKRGNWWVLNTPRLDMDFEGEKIVTPYRTKELRFAYSNEEWYASRDVYYIVKKKPDVKLLFILGLLNSNLYYNWYYHRGKRKGDTLEIYAKPLKETPILYLENRISNKIVSLVRTIIEEKTKKPSFDETQLQFKIDLLVYKLYDLDFQDVLIVDQDIENKITEYDYKQIFSEYVN